MALVLMSASLPSVFSSLSDTFTSLGRRVIRLLLMNESMAQDIY